MKSTRVRVYYEDTDSGGVVYYANYLKYCERGRTEFFRDSNLSIAGLDSEGYLFVVARVEASYRSPAHHDDLLEVRTGVESLGRASISFSQRIFHVETDRLMVDAKVKVACTDKEGKVRPLPVSVRAAMETDIEKDAYG